MKQRSILGGIALLLSGCAMLGKADAPITMRLSPSFAAGPATPGSIEVAPVQARGVTAAARYAYFDAQAPGEIRQAKSFFWEEPPPRVLERALIAGLKARFDSVAPSGLGARAQRRVTATLTRFEEADAGGAARAVVAFEAVVTRDGKVEASQAFCGASPIAGASGTARAQGFEQAIQAAVGGLVQAMATGAAAPASC